MNGCHNRKPLKNIFDVQDGWYESRIYRHNGSFTRTPFMKTIDIPMTKTCQYQILKKDDPKCSGCKELIK